MTEKSIVAEAAEIFLKTMAGVKIALISNLNDQDKVNGEGGRNNDGWGQQGRKNPVAAMHLYIGFESRAGFFISFPSPP